MRSLLLVDTSAWRRIASTTAVAAAYRTLLDHHDGLAYCVPQLLEWGYSARSASDRKALLASVQAAAERLTLSDDVGATAMDLQRRLWSRNRGRAVGVQDLLIAAHAVVHSTRSVAVTVVHYDSDYEHVAAVEPSFRQQWIVPRGSVD